MRLERKSTNIYEILRKSKKIQGGWSENRRSSMKIVEDRKKIKEVGAKINENLWTAMKINENLRKSTKINEHQ